jgi:hypothetical protein
VTCADVRSDQALLTASRLITGDLICPPYHAEPPDLTEDRSGQRSTNELAAL